MAAISTGRVVQDDDAGKVPMDHREVLNVTAQLQRAVLGAGLMLDTPPESGHAPQVWPHPLGYSPKCLQPMGGKE